HPTYTPPPDTARPHTQSRTELETALLALSHAIVATALQPASPALFRVIVAEAPRVPHLAALFRTAVAERGGATFRSLLARAEAQGLVVVADRDAAARLLIGSMLTYVLSDGLF